MIFGVYRMLSPKKEWKTSSGKFPLKWRDILKARVDFYNFLDKAGKISFEKRVQEFILNYRITGVETAVDDTDKVLVAASAIIPVFQFPDWRYDNLDEVMLYPSGFNEQFETSGADRNILGMVGTGYMEGKMVLSKAALHHGFSNRTDKRNTAVHEFVHLIDKSDGNTDGIPAALLDKQYAVPWIDLIYRKIDEIKDGESDINPYGATNKAEFFAVAGEYFFERPKVLRDKHPELYNMMNEMFVKRN